jgi:hypothetical protein
MKVLKPLVKLSHIFTKSKTQSAHVYFVATRLKLTILISALTNLTILIPTNQLLVKEIKKKFFFVELYNIKNPSPILL